VVDHPYSQTVALFPDDSVITANAAGSNLSTPQALSLILNTWIEDTIYALDHLSELNEADPVLAGAFDLDHVGAFGHSFGGATAANVSLVDDRVLASINMMLSCFISLTRSAGLIKGDFLGISFFIAQRSKTQVILKPIKEIF
ncbi:MAG: hypothetical protein ACXWV6_11060, partial [Chitinophagaceae bacterium]